MIQKIIRPLYLLLLMIILMLFIACQGVYPRSNPSITLENKNKVVAEGSESLIVRLNPAYINSLKVDSDIRIVVKNNTSNNICLPLDNLDIYVIENGTTSSKVENQVKEFGDDPCLILVPKGSRGFVEWEYWIRLDLRKKSEVNIRIIAKGKVVKNGVTTDEAVTGSLDLVLIP